MGDKTAKLTMEKFLKDIEESMCHGKSNEKDMLTKVQHKLVKLSHSLDGKKFATCFSKYLDYLIHEISFIKNIKKQIQFCNETVSSIKDVILQSNSLSEGCVTELTEKIFIIIIVENPGVWILKKEILKFFNLCLQKVKKSTRNATIQKLETIYLLKLIDSVSSFSDYDFQVSLIETVFRLYGRHLINKKLTDLIPESQELSQSFGEIHPDTFDEDARSFLNALNKSSQRIFSIVCSTVNIDNIKCKAPMDDVNGIWVDFNLSDKIMTWYCRHDSFYEEKSDEEVNNWVLLSLFSSDVEKIDIKSFQNRSLIFMKLRAPCICLEEEISIILSDIRTVAILLEDSPLTQHFIGNILRKWSPECFCKTELGVHMNSNVDMSDQTDNAKILHVRKYVNLDETAPVSGMEPFSMKSARSGSNSLIESHSRTQYVFEQHCDVISLHSSISSELSAVERDFESIRILSGRTADISFQHTNMTLQHSSHQIESSSQEYHSAKDNTNTEGFHTAKESSESVKKDENAKLLKANTCSLKKVTELSIASDDTRPNSFIEESFHDSEFFSEDAKKENIPVPIVITNEFSSVQNVDDIIEMSPENATSKHTTKKKKVQQIQDDKTMKVNTFDRDSESERPLNSNEGNKTKEITKKDQIQETTEKIVEISTEVSQIREYEGIKDNIVDKVYEPVNKASHLKKTRQNKQCVPVNKSKVQRISKKVREKSIEESQTEERKRENTVDRVYGNETKIIQVIKENENNEMVKNEDVQKLSEKLLETFSEELQIENVKETKEKPTDKVNEIEIKASRLKKAKGNDEIEIVNKEIQEILESSIEDSQTENDEIEEKPIEIKSSQLKKTDRNEHIKLVKKEKVQKIRKKTENSIEEIQNEDGEKLIETIEIKKCCLKKTKKNEKMVNKVSSRDLEDADSRESKKDKKRIGARMALRDINVNIIGQRISIEEENIQDKETFQDNNQDEITKQTKSSEDNETYMKEKGKQDTEKSAKNNNDSESKILQKAKETNVADENKIASEDTTLYKRKTKARRTKKVVKHQKSTQKIEENIEDESNLKPNIGTKNSTSDQKVVSDTGIENDLIEANLLCDEKNKDISVRKSLMEQRHESTKKSEQNKMTKRRSDSEYEITITQDSNSNQILSDKKIIVLSEVTFKPKKNRKCKKNHEDPPKAKVNPAENPNFTQENCETSKLKNESEENESLENQENSSENDETRKSLQNLPNEISITNTVVQEPTSVINQRKEQKLEENIKLPQSFEEYIFNEASLSLNRINYSKEQLTQLSVDSEFDTKDKENSSCDNFTKKRRSQKISKFRTLSRISERSEVSHEGETSNVNKAVKYKRIRKLSDSEEILPVEKQLRVREIIIPLERSNLVELKYQQVKKIVPADITDNTVSPEIFNEDSTNLNMEQTECNSRLSETVSQIAREIETFNKESGNVVNKITAQADVDSDSDYYYDDEYPVNTAIGPKPVINPETAFDKLIRESEIREKEQTLKLMNNQEENEEGGKNLIIAKKHEIDLNKIAMVNNERISPYGDVSDKFNQSFQIINDNSEMFENLPKTVTISTGYKANEKHDAVVTTDKENIGNGISIIDIEMNEENEQRRKITPEMNDEDMVLTQISRKSEEIQKVRDKQEVGAKVSNKVVKAIRKDSSGEIEGITSIFTQISPKNSRSGEDKRKMDKTIIKDVSNNSRNKKRDAIDSYDIIETESELLLKNKMSKQQNKDVKKVDKGILDAKHLAKAEDNNNMGKNEILVEALVHEVPKTQRRSVTFNETKLDKDINKTIGNEDQVTKKKSDFNQTLSTTVSNRSLRRKRILYDPEVPMEQYIADNVSIYNKSLSVLESKISKTTDTKHDKIDEIMNVDQEEENDKEVESILSGTSKKVNQEQVNDDIINLDDSMEIRRPTEKIETKKSSRVQNKQKRTKVVKEKNLTKIIVNNNVNFRSTPKKGNKLVSAFEDMLQSFRNELGGRTLLEEMELKKRKAMSAKSKRKKTYKNKLPSETSRRNDLVSFGTPYLADKIDYDTYKSPSTSELYSEDNTKKTYTKKRSNTKRSNQGHKKKMPSNISKRNALVSLGTTNLANRMSNDKDSTLEVDSEEYTEKAFSKKILSDMEGTVKKKLMKYNEPTRFDELFTNIPSIDENIETVPRKKRKLEQDECFCQSLVMVSQPAPSWHGIAVKNEKFVELKSEDFLGKYLVLFFYPLDFGFHPYAQKPKEIISFNEKIEEFRAIDCEIVTCSVDSHYTHLAWIKRCKEKKEFENLEIILLSDSTHTISKSYHIYKPTWGHTIRSLFIINPKGAILQENLLDAPFEINVNNVLEQVKYIRNIERDIA